MAQEFESEFDSLEVEVRRRLGAHLVVLAEQGPGLGRPLADTLKGSKYPNMKELRFSIGKQVWRFAFAFDPLRQGVVLLGAIKLERTKVHSMRTSFERRTGGFRYIWTE